MRAAPFAPARAAPLELRGSAVERGRGQAQACPGAATAVREAVSRRLRVFDEVLWSPRVQEYLARQWEFAARHDPDGIAELDGIAAGYGVPVRDLFASLHAGQLLPAGEPESADPCPVCSDACSAWAVGHPEFDALAGKNRDLPADARALQRVFRNGDPAWGGRTVLCVGSLGSPGVYSSGVNSNGLALADTAIPTRDLGIGLLRYFVMTRLLAHCSTVEEALDEVRRTRHAGGGSLVLADARGAVAAVELGHHTVAVERGTAPPGSSDAAGWVARTNHFVSAELGDAAESRAGDPGRSHGRLRLLRTWLGGAAQAPSIDEAASFMASHDDDARAGLCRHGGTEGTTTISAGIFDCRHATLYFCADNPCAGVWSTFACAEVSGGV